MKTVYPDRTRQILPVNSFKMLPVLAATILSAFIVSAQSYYPGGIGNSNLIVWLNAGNSSSITQSGGGVSLWSDLSGHAYNFAQNTASRRPNFSASIGPGSRGSVMFNASTTNYLSRSSMASSISYAGGVSSLSVASFSASNSSQGFERIYDFANAAATPTDAIWLGRYGTTANLGYESRSGTSVAQTYTTGGPIVNSAYNIYEAVQQGGTAGTLSSVGLYAAGAAQAGSGTNGSTTYVPASVARTSDYIGRSNWSADDYLGGSISEILFYNTAVNATQRIILENYLSAAWSIGVSNTYYTPPSNTYYSNLVGIGYTSATDYFLADVSGSTDGLGFSTTNTATGFLNTAGYVMAAHNKQTNSILSGVTISGVGSNLNRWNRSWNMQKTGGNGSGTITFNFNFSDYNGAMPTSTYSYGLLYNATDGSFATGTNKLITLSGSSISGNIVALSATATNLPAGYYTLVWSTSALLPVTLPLFTVTGQSGNGNLQWNLSYDPAITRIDVQRSADAVDFITLGSVKPTDSQANGLYRYIDDTHPGGMNFYRLKMVHFDGAIGYSWICALDFPRLAAASFAVYPNPAAGVLHLTGAAAGTEFNIRILNGNGQCMRTMRVIASNSTGLPLTNLPKGIYMAEISAGNTVAGLLRFVKQ